MTSEDLLETVEGESKTYRLKTLKRWLNHNYEAAELQSKLIFSSPQKVAQIGITMYGDSITTGCVEEALGWLGY